MSNPINIFINLTSPQRFLLRQSPDARKLVDLYVPLKYKRPLKHPADGSFLIVKFREHVLLCDRLIGIESRMGPRSESRGRQNEFRERDRVPNGEQVRNQNREQDRIVFGSANEISIIRILSHKLHFKFKPPTLAQCGIGAPKDLKTTVITVILKSGTDALYILYQATATNTSDIRVIQNGDPSRKCSASGTMAGAGLSQLALAWRRRARPKKWNVNKPLRPWLLRPN
ncbi:hypothetical protein EVAR_69735_1 [Eumeta japonica]|uniref:Uncharacterized protein n=1 Tax=Eumeta variegata TaxID=151549 RepID=A0A4C1TDW2_EUMVA|nr:hypothetical protein EVAR_69735_1 [Eumeta japonica]